MLEEVLKRGLEHPRSYLIRGEKEVLKEALFGAIEGVWGLVMGGNPNVFSIDGHMNVDEARGLIEFASMSPFGADKIKIIFLSAERMTQQAQNTILKLTEEPNQSLRIFVIVPKDVELLETLLSRLEDISYAFLHSTNNLQLETSNFLLMGLKDRLKLAEKISKVDDETALDTFLRDLEKTIYKQKYKNLVDKQKSFEAISFAKKNSAFQSRPKRMILESLAISLPVV